jgi:hypothetical protein
MDLSPAVSSLTSSPSTGEDRGEGALIFCPLTLTLSRKGRENPSPCIVQKAKYFVGLRLDDPITFTLCSNPSINIPESIQTMAWVFYEFM